MDAKASISAMDIRYCFQVEVLSPSQWPTFAPAPAKVLRVMTIGLLSGLRLNIASRLAELITATCSVRTQEYRPGVKTWKGLTCSIKIVRIVFYQTIGMDKIGEYSMVAEGPCSVLDHVRWIDVISSWQAHHGSSCRLPLDSAASTWRLKIGGKPRNRSWRCAHWWRRWRETILDRKALRIAARPSAEIRSLVHVDPQSININTVSGAKECVKFPVPVSLRVLIEPVRESCDARPDNP